MWNNICPPEMMIRICKQGAFSNVTKSDAGTAASAYYVLEFLLSCDLYVLVERISRVSLWSNVQLLL